MSNDTEKENIELSVDDLEGAAGGLILTTEDGRYITKDEFNGSISYIGYSLEQAREAAIRRDLSTRVMTKSEYERRKNS